MNVARVATDQPLLLGYCCWLHSLVPKGHKATLWDVNLILGVCGQPAWSSGKALGLLSGRTQVRLPASNIVIYGHCPVTLPLHN